MNSAALLDALTTIAQIEESSEAQIANEVRQTIGTLPPQARKQDPRDIPAKKVTGYLKLLVRAGAANPRPPIETALRQRGLNIMEIAGRSTPGPRRRKRTP